MKIALTTSGTDPSAPLDSRFGRAAKFLLYDLETDSWELLDNAQSLDAAQGAGVQAAESVVRAGARAVITGHCGPKAFRVLAAAGVKVYHSGAATVAEALQQYLGGRLAESQAADVEGHWV